MEPGEDNGGGARENPRPLDPQKARRLLEEAGEGAALVHRALGPYYGAWLAIWGAVYAAGYTLVALDSPLADPAFGVLGLAGFVLSYVVGHRAAHFFRTMAGRSLAVLWAGFGVTAAALVMASPRLSGDVFSLAINELAALALWQTGHLVSAPRMRLAAGGFALLNAGLFAYAPPLYAPTLAALGLTALLLGLKRVSDGLR